MKKLITLITCAAMIMCLVGCGKTASGTAQAGVLVMATNAEFPPYEYHEGNAIVGIDAEIAAAIAEKMGCELKIEDIAFDAIIPEVTSGKADMGMAGMTVTDQMLQQLIAYYEKNNKKKVTNMTASSSKELKVWLKALIGRNLYGDEAFYPVVNKSDKVILKALEVL